jgi:ribosomal protein L32
MARVAVRCSRGHLFSTEWVPLASFKAVRLGSRDRYQRCPDCGRFRMVHRVEAEEIGEALHARAMAHVDGKGV